MKIGNLTLNGVAALAPMAGATDRPFREICCAFGAAYCVTEMVSTRALQYNYKKTEELITLGEKEHPVAIQLFGDDPQIFASAAQRAAQAGPDAIDINMGCPVPKVFKNGEGSALLADMPRAEKIISACKESGKKITVKFRIGLERGKPFAAEFAKMCEGAGADMLTVHGRTRDMVYAGEPDYAQIAAAKNAVNIPVIANGGVFTRADAEKMLEETGADGIMLARAAMYDPHVFAEILGKEGSEWDRRAAIEGQIADMLPFYGEKFTLVQMRKMAAFYIRGMRGSSAFRAKLLACGSIAELRAALDEIFSA